MTLGKYLKQKREEAGLKQSDVARALGHASSQYTSNVERGISKPAMHSLKKLCRVLKIDPKEMRKIMIDDCVKKIEKYI